MRTENDLMEAMNDKLLSFEENSKTFTEDESKAIEEWIEAFAERLAHWQGHDDDLPEVSSIDGRPLSPKMFSFLDEYFADKGWYLDGDELDEKYFYMISELEGNDE